MSELFDPDFNISFNLETDYNELVKNFRISYDSIITWWQGRRGETQDYYIGFHAGRAYELKLTPYEYLVTIIGKQGDYDDDAQSEHKSFAQSILKFLRENGCAIGKFSATFSIDDESVE